MSEIGKDIIEGLQAAIDYADGKPGPARVHTVEVPNVRAIREQLKMSQQEFSSAYRIPLPTLQGWEQGRRQPDATAAAFLSVIARMPKETSAALHS
jgi:putative transcriptional regulator